MNCATENPVIIIGAGISGLLVAQSLRKHGIPFRIFERDADFSTRGLGCGLTLHWSLPALRSLLPDELVKRLPEAYVDRAAVEKGQVSTFPFFDLSTGELKASTPPAPESGRIRVNRDRFRRLLATDIDIQWGKAVGSFDLGDESVTVRFDDGSSCDGRLLVACDGSNSRVRRVLFPQQENYRIPIEVLGIKVEYSPGEIKLLRDLDPFFLQGTSSKNDTYLYFSMLDAPHQDTESSGKYSCQMVSSWPIRSGFFNEPSPVSIPPTNASRIHLIKSFAETWAEPFRSLVLDIPESTDVKFLELHDWPPPKDFQGTGRVVLVGDSFHPMAMYRGEGANHAIVDVLDLVELVIPHVLTQDGGMSKLREAIDTYEGTVVARSRPAVLASRQACLDAHQWDSINEKSPLLSRRAMRLDFDEDGHR